MLIAEWVSWTTLVLFGLTIPKFCLPLPTRHRFMPRSSLRGAHLSGEPSPRILPKFPNSQAASQPQAVGHLRAPTSPPYPPAAAPPQDFPPLLPSLAASQGPDSQSTPLSRICHRLHRGIFPVLGSLDGRRWARWMEAKMAPKAQVISIPQRQLRALN